MKTCLVYICTEKTCVFVLIRSVVSETINGNFVNGFLGKGLSNQILFNQELQQRVFSFFKWGLLEIEVAVAEESLVKLAGD